MQDAGIAFLGRMAVADKNIALRRDDHRIGFVEGIEAIARHARRAQYAQQFAILVEFLHVIADAAADMTVHDPQMVVLV